MGNVFGACCSASMFSLFSCPHTSTLEGAELVASTYCPSLVSLLEEFLEEFSSPTRTHGGCSRITRGTYVRAKRVACICFFFFTFPSLACFSILYQGSVMSPDGVMPLPDFKELAKKPRKKERQKKATEVGDKRQAFQVQSKSSRDG